MTLLYIVGLFRGEEEKEKGSFTVQSTRTDDWSYEIQFSFNESQIWNAELLGHVRKI